MAFARPIPLLPQTPFHRPLSTHRPALLTASASYTRGKSSTIQPIYLPVPSFSPGTTLAIPAAEQRHLRARRISPPAQIRLFNGRGAAADADLLSLSSAVVTAAHEAPSLGVAVDACFCLPSASRADWAVEKLTEVGVGRVYCLTADRGGEKGRRQRLERVAVAAAKQSLGEVVPVFEDVDGVGGAVRLLREGRYDLGVVLAGWGKAVNDVLGDMRKVLVVVGPEGGFTEDEEDELVAGGFVRARLGPRRLRVETAIVLAAAAVVFSAEAGADAGADMGGLGGAKHR